MHSVSTSNAIKKEPKKGGSEIGFSIKELEGKDWNSNTSIGSASSKSNDVDEVKVLYQDSNESFESINAFTQQKQESKPKSKTDSKPNLKTHSKSKPKTNPKSNPKPNS